VAAALFVGRGTRLCWGGEIMPVFVTRGQALFSGRKASVFHLTRLMARVFLAPFFGMEVLNQDSVPKEGAFILLPKHQRWEDIPLLALASPRPVYYVAKYELFVNPLSAWYIRSLGGIPLNRKRPLESRAALRGVLEVLKMGEGVVIFPEGTYFRDRMGPGHAGLIRMIRSQIAVSLVPVGIRYSGTGRKHVEIKFGRPLFEDPSTRPEALRNRIMEDIARLSGL
jgi:1-acyl-sn-glycerol-3-phosphate acyltransferase